MPFAISFVLCGPAAAWPQRQVRVVDLRGEVGWVEIDRLAPMWEGGSDGEDRQ
jgi:hypothetical protein